MCADALESTTNSRSSGLLEVGSGITLASTEEQRSFVHILELVNIFATSHATLRAHLSWCKVSSCDLSLIWARKDYAHEVNILG